MIHSFIETILIHTMRVPIEPSFSLILVEITHLFCIRKYFTARKTKLREGNVFTGICHSVWGVLGTRHTSWDRSLGRNPPPPDMGPGNLPPYPHYWHLVVITGDLSKLVHLWTYHPLVLTSGGGHRTSGTHPTGMLSSLQTNAYNRVIFLLENRTLLENTTVFINKKYRPDIRFVRYFDGNKLETFTFLLFSYFWM